MKTGKGILILHALLRIEHGCARVLLHVAERRPDREAPYGISQYDENREVAHLDDLFCSAYIGTDSPSYGGPLKPRKPYGMEIEFGGGLGVNLAKAERMTRVLRKIEKSMQAAYEQDGPAATFGQYAARFARAIKAEGVVVETDVRGTPDAAKHENGRRFVFWSTGKEIVWAIDTMIADWQKANGGIPVEAAQN